MQAAKLTQKVTATPSIRSRARMPMPPATMTTKARVSPTDRGPHQKSSGLARPEPSTRKHATRPKFDGLNTARPPTRIRYLESNDTATAAAKIQAPCSDHQSPWTVPGTRRISATPLPVSSALAGQTNACVRRKSTTTSIAAAVPRATRIWAIDSSKPRTV